MAEEIKKEDDKEVKSLTNLLNPPFTFILGDREFQVRKANIKQVQQYQLKVTELSKNTDLPSAVKDLDIVSYALFLVLNKTDNSVTEDFVKENLPGNINIISLLSELGFIDPQKAELVNKLQEKILSDASSR
jgi:hypothetical protein